MGEYRGHRDYEKSEAKKNKKNGEVFLFFFFGICMRKKEGKDKGRDRAREHSDIAMLPRSM